MNIHKNKYVSIYFPEYYSLLEEKWFNECIFIDLSRNKRACYDSSRSSKLLIPLMRFIESGSYKEDHAKLVVERSGLFSGRVVFDKYGYTYQDKRYKY